MKSKKIKIVTGLGLFFSLLMILEVFANRMTQTMVYNIHTKQFKSQDYGEIFDKIQNKESGIYYFGFPSCPWCKEMLPVLRTCLRSRFRGYFEINLCVFWEKNADLVVLNWGFLTKKRANFAKIDRNWRLQTGS